MGKPIEVGRTKINRHCCACGCKGGRGGGSALFVSRVITDSLIVLNVLLVFTEHAGEQSASML